MVLQGTQVVKPVNVNAFLTKIGARQHTDGVIHGLAFEFSDGSKVNLSDHAGPDSDPYEIDNDVMHTEWIEAPDGFDRLQWGAVAGVRRENWQHDRQCGQALKSLKMYKDGNLIASNKVSGECCQFNRDVKVLDGFVIGILIINVTCSVKQSFYFSTAHGVRLPTPAVDGGWSGWSDWTKCLGDCSIGAGVHESARVCDNPTPQGKGIDCVGNTIRRKACDLECAPGPKPEPEPEPEKSFFEKNKFVMLLILIICIYLFMTKEPERKPCGYKPSNNNLSRVT